MALGLVQPRSGDYVFKASLQDQMNSPRHIRKQRTFSLSKVPDDIIASLKVQVSLDIVLDTPVLIVPRSSSSPHVLVAHLGRISISNYCNNIDDQYDENIIKTDSYKGNSEDSEENLFDDIDKTIKGSIFGDNLNNDDDDVYSIEIRNLNLFSLDTSTRKGFRLSALPRSEEFYSCEQDAVAIIHDTTIRLEICRKITDSAFVNIDSSTGSFVTISESNDEIINQLVISGSIVNPLRLSLKRPQYEQLIDTIENAFSIPNDLIRPPKERSKYNVISSESIIDETYKPEDRKKDLFNARKDAEMLPKILFTLPVFIIQLNNADNLPVVEICFRDFNVTFEKISQWETKLQVALRSVIMEDLLQPIESKHRIMVTSTNDRDDDQRLQTPFLSNSCPDLTAAFGGCSSLLSSSLPNNLEQNVGFSQFMKQRKRMMKINTLPTPNCDTPPPSPQMKIIDDNLVIYSSLLIDSECPQFESKYESMRAKSCIDFNCLNLNISVESWFVLLNFFGLLSSDDESITNKATNVSSQAESEQNQNGKSELNITIKSLNLILVKPEYELARANVSNARFIITKSEVDKKIDGSLGSISVSDLTFHGCIYREKFMTSGNEALKFIYLRECPKPLIGKRSLKKDAQLSIKMSSVRYVHTKRYGH